MTAPLYFCPRASAEGLRRRDPDALEAHRLRDVLSDAPQSHYSTTELKGAGPGGLPGCIIAAWSDEIPKFLGYYPQHQDWSPVGDGSQLWIGRDKLRPVTPADVQRPRTIRGHKVELGDGNSWEIPVYRLLSGDYGVPFAMYRDAGGEFRQQVAEEHQRRWEAAGDVWQKVMLGNGRATFDFADVLDYCVDAIGANYRINHDLNAVLQLVTSETWEDVLMATIDMPKFLELVQQEQKKTSTTAASTS